MDTKLIVAIAICIFATVQAKKYCSQDSDCSDLGGLFCIKSSCNWGICACPRSTVARWLGSERLYQCVPLKKNGESCSTDGDAGVCGAPGARCNSGTCQCSSGVSIWGGEYCASDSQKTGPGESCSSSIGSCSLSAGSACLSTTGTNWHDEVISFDYPTCSCPNNQQLVISNWYNAFDYIGRKQPVCVQKTVGSFCLKNSDCDQIGGTSTAECVNNACACPAGSVTDYLGASCNNGTALGYGGVCSGTNYQAFTFCDGTAGLVCGDTCTVFETVPTQSLCRCGHRHTLSGSTCNANTVGSTCFGDQNCKSINSNAICVDGKCENSAMSVAVTMGTIFAALLAAIFVY